MGGASASGAPGLKKILTYLADLWATVRTTGSTKSAQVNLRDASGNELGTAAGLALKVDVSGDFPDNIQGAVEHDNPDVDPLTPGHKVKAVKTGGHANAAAPTAVTENDVVDSSYDLQGNQRVMVEDGKDTALGAIADAAATAGGTGTVSAKLRLLTALTGALAPLGSAIPVIGTLMAGSDGTDARALKVNTDGTVNVEPRVTPGTNAATGSAAISQSYAPGYDFYLEGVTIHFNTAPTTAGVLTVTLNATDGAAYDTLLFSIDPTTGSVKDLVYQPDNPLLCRNGDSIDIAYTNADNRTYGSRILVRRA